MSNWDKMRRVVKLALKLKMELILLKLNGSKTVSKIDADLSVL